VLAQVAAEISDADSNILDVGMDDDRGMMYTSLHFKLEVSDRIHLARIMRSIRRIPEVERIVRLRDGKT
jgi:guanosine-3',5'-bis(diphosphate) 3'-pyrophosphohydrolase